MQTVLLHHGLLGGGIRVGPLYWQSFAGIDRAIEARGFRVAMPSVHPTAAIETRALQLKRWIENHHELLGGKRLILFAHSLGGLDARYMLARLGMADRIEALVTISTPHRGSAFADWCVANLGRRLGMLRVCEQLGMDVAAVMDLTTQSCAGFNQEIGDAEGVRYYSVAAWNPWGRMPIFAMHSQHVIEKAQGPNDGLVAVQSAKWGNHLATWQANHWESCNRRYGLRGRLRGMDIPAAYVAVLEAVVADAGN